MLNLYVIGCGGVGGYLIDMLPMTISSLSLDMLQSSSQPIEKYLENAGSIALPSIVDRLVLVDGDTFNARNTLRQGAGAGSKLAGRMLSIKKSMLYVSYLQRMQLIGYNSYVNPGNVSKIIPREPDPNRGNEVAEHLYSALPDHKRNATVVFMAVDNAKTRYELSMYMENFENCLVLNGGNEKTTGHVTIYERSKGVALDPNLPEIYPNITADADQRPDELDCTHVAPAHDQIAVTNSIVANIMLACFNKWVRSGFDVTVGSGEKAKTTRKNEVIIDCDKMSMTSLHHPLAHKSP